MASKQVTFLILSVWRSGGGVVIKDWDCMEVLMMGLDRRVKTLFGKKIKRVWRKEKEETKNGNCG